MRASPDRAAMMRQEEADMLGRLKRAAADVMELGLSLDEARTNRRVSEARLRAELKRLGWQSRIKNPPGPRRLSSETARGTQLPRTRSDNQS